MTKQESMIANLKKAIGNFEEALSFPSDEPHRESLIQRFEYTFELSWKLMSQILKEEGVEVFGVKSIIRAAAKLGLLKSVDTWFRYLEYRNETSHIYHEEIAIEVAHKVRKDFLAEVQEFFKKAENYISQQKA